MTSDKLGISCSRRFFLAVFLVIDVLPDGLDMAGSGADGLGVDGLAADGLGVDGLEARELVADLAFLVFIRVLDDEVASFDVVTPLEELELGCCKSGELLRDDRLDLLTRLRAASTAPFSGGGLRGNGLLLLLAGKIFVLSPAG